MELHRTRTIFFLIALFLLGGPLIVWSSLNGWELRFLILPLGSGALLAMGLVMTLGALAGLASAFRPGPLTIDEAGLRLRVAGISRFLPWASVDALILEPNAGTLDKNGRPRLVLVPAADVDLGVAAEYQNKVDGRPSVILLSLDSIRESHDQIKGALSKYAGQRFVDGVSGDETRQATL